MSVWEGYDKIVDALQEIVRKSFPDWNKAVVTINYCTIDTMYIAKIRINDEYNISVSREEAHLALADLCVEFGHFREYHLGILKGQ